MGFHSAEEVRDEEGRQYHIGLAPGEVSRRVLLVGDPARARRVATLFDDVKGEWSNREYVTITGTWKGLELSVMATGMGCDNMEIAVVELSQLVDNPIFIRAGSCGGLQKDMELGDLVISTGAARLENISTFFVHEGFPAVAHHEVIMALLLSVRELGHKYHVGITATGSGFYGAQGRTAAGFVPRQPDLPDQLATMGVKNFEMESSTLFTLGAMKGYRVGTVCAVYANRPQNVFIDKDFKQEAEMRCIQAGLGAFVHLDRFERERGDEPFWTPTAD